MAGTQLQLSKQFCSDHYVGHAVELRLPSNSIKRCSYRIHDEVHDEVRPRSFGESYGEQLLLMHGESSRPKSGFGLGDDEMVQFAIYHGSEVAARDNASYLWSTPMVVQP